MKKLFNITLISSLFILGIFSIGKNTKLIASEYHDTGYALVLWDVMHFHPGYCSGNNKPYFEYYFSDAGSYDKINATAANYCNQDSYYKIQAESKDGKGQFVQGSYVSNGQNSYANQGAERGNDYVSYDALT